MVQPRRGVRQKATSDPGVVPSSDWQVDVLAAASRLESELARASEDPPEQTTATARQAIARAREIAEGKVHVGYVRDRWSGLRVESAWRALQLAQEELLLIRPKQELLAEVPYWIRVAESRGAQELVKTLESWQTQADLIDPLLVKPALTATHIANNSAHMALRRLRNRVLILAGLVGALVIAVWSIGEVTTGDIVGIGALAGLLSVVFSIKNADLSAAYNVQLAQGLLKVATGAATAVLAVLILKGSGASSDNEHVYAYAAIFGFSQQAFTRLVDEKAQSLTAKTPPRLPAATPKAMTAIGD